MCDTDDRSNARRNADRVVSEAREHAEKSLSESMVEAERERTTAQRQVEDLNRQREAITSYLDELRNLLGNDPVPSRLTLQRASQSEANFAAASTRPRADTPAKGSPKGTEGSARTVKGRPAPTATPTPRLSDGTGRGSGVPADPAVSEPATGAPATGEANGSGPETAVDAATAPTAAAAPSPATEATTDEMPAPTAATQ